MAFLSLRLSDEELAGLRAGASVQGLSLSAHVRKLLAIGDEATAVEDEIEGLERRVSRLEEMAGL
jgi:hypothetical protein